jgi:hypothetical protein
MKIERLILLAPDDGGGDGGSGTTTGDGSGAGTLLAGAGSGAGDPPAGLTGPDGKFAEGWLDRLPEEFTDAKPTLSKYGSVQDLAKAHYHLQKKIGNPGVQIPTEKSSPEEVAAFRKALGVPEAPDKYELLPEQLPEGVEVNPELLKPYAEIAHKHNIPAAAMKDLVAENIKQAALANEAAGGIIAQRLADGEKQLRTTFGGEYDSRLNMAKRAASAVGLDLKSHGLTDPNVVIALAQLGDMMSEDKLASGDGNLPMGGKHRAKDIMTNEANPLYKKYQDGDEETVKLVTRLLSQG